MQSEALLLTLFFVLAGISGASLMLLKFKDKGTDMQSEALLLTLFFVLAGISGASLMLFKFKVAPLRRSALLGHKKPSQPLNLLTAMLFSLALISGCFAGALIGALIGTLLSGQPAKTIAARLNEKFLIIFFVSFAMATLVFFLLAHFVFPVLP